MKHCTKCKQLKPLSEYHKDKNAGDGHVQRCKQCVKIKSRQWYWDNYERNVANRRKRYWENPIYWKTEAKAWADKNREHKRALDSKYQKAHPEVYKASAARRKARIRQNGVYAISQKEMRKLYASPCLYCGSTQRIEADHVIPIARGGTHSIGNLVPACKSCNASKRQRTITEWKKENPRNQSGGLHV